MASHDAEQPEFIAVVCPVCRARMDARVRDEPSRVECPDCFTEVDVPARQAVLASQPVKREQPDFETYAIAGAADPPRQESPAVPAVVALHCPSCGRTVDAEPGERARNITCPECLEVIPVPALRDARPKPKRRRKRTYSPGFDDEDDLPPEDLDRELPPPDLLKAEGEIRREPPPPIPTWTFFTRVFTLPWQPEVLSRWAYTSLGWSVLGLAIASIHWLILNGYLIGVPFFALPIVLLVLWTGSFAVSSAMTVVEDTASGNDAIAHFNDGGWGDWLADMYGPVFLAAIACTASYLVANTVAVTVGIPWFWPVLSGTFFLLFPIALLSALQAGSYWTPLTLTVLKTLFRKAWAWGVFYVLAGLVVAAYVAPVLFGLSRGQWFLTLFLTGPLFSTAMFISARLLGRLAWKAIVVEEERKAESRKRKAEKATDG